MPPDPAPVVPATPPPNLFLTGLSFLNGVKHAYLVVNKAGGKQPEYLSVEEGYDGDNLQVLEIDPRKQAVRVRNAGTEVTLNFKDNSLKPNSVPVGGPGGPGMPPNRVPPPPGGYSIPQPMAQAAPAATAPTIIGRGGVAAADTAATAASAAAVLDAAAGAETPLARQLPARRSGVYLGAGNGTGTASANGDGGPIQGLPVAPTRPGVLNNGGGPGTRPNPIVPPVPVIPGQ